MKSHMPTTLRSSSQQRTGQASNQHSDQFSGFSQGQNSGQEYCSNTGPQGQNPSQVSRLDSISQVLPVHQVSEGQQQNYISPANQQIFVCSTQSTNQQRQQPCQQQSSQKSYCQGYQQQSSCDAYQSQMCHDNPPEEYYTKPGEHYSKPHELPQQWICAQKQQQTCQKQQQPAIKHVAKQDDYYNKVSLLCHSDDTYKAPCNVTKCEAKQECTQNQCHNLEAAKGVLSEGAQCTLAERLKETRCGEDIIIDVKETVTETRIPLHVKAPTPPPPPKIKPCLHVEFLNECDMHKFVGLVDKCCNRGKSESQGRLEDFLTCYQVLKRDKTQYVLVCKDSFGKLHGALTFSLEYKFLHECAKTLHLQEIFLANKKRHEVFDLLMTTVVNFANRESCYRVSAMCTEAQEDQFIQLGFTPIGSGMILDLQSTK